MPSEHITLVIEAPVGKPWTHQFDKDATIEGLILEILSHFGLQPAKYELRHGSTVLEPSRTVESYHFTPDTILELVPDHRSGV